MLSLFLKIILKYNIENNVGHLFQAATSHHLGQNFSKMFDISFEDPETKQRRYAYQNSWAITTRSIGVIVMVHGDNKGLVLPPEIAVYQVKLLCIVVKNILWLDLCVGAGTNSGHSFTLAVRNDILSQLYKY